MSISVNENIQKASLNENNEVAQRSNHSSCRSESSSSFEESKLEPDILDISGLQSTAHEFGCIISSNSRSKVIVKEVIDHIDMPSYPKTTSTGVAHFIHLNKPLFELLATKTQVYKTSTQIMSKIQFSHTKTNFNIVKLDILSKNKKREKQKA
ncbi:hypothetical protein B0O99DRAFT_602886 [Bisporella sp. PMI_857]|nr:hypothetical protein B0O99DRAFT_602886 [Bisporella sp. PMI_857]